MNDEPSGVAFWLGAAIGASIAGFGVYGVVTNLHGVALSSWLKAFAGGLVVHDLLFAPLVALGSVLVVGLVRGRARAPVQAAFVVSAALVLVAIPVVHGAGRLANNPSLLPSDRYGTRLVAVLAVVWSIALIVAVVRVRRSSCL